MVIFGFIMIFFNRVNKQLLIDNKVMFYFFLILILVLVFVNFGLEIIVGN